MFEGLRGGASRIRLIAYAVLAPITLFSVIGVAFSFIWSQYHLGSEAYQKYNDRTYSNQEKAAADIASICNVTPAPSSVIAKCLEAQIRSYESQYSTNEDLKAQKDMAFWAFWMFIASAFSALISVAGLTLLFVSLRQTRTAIKDTREIGEAQVRAYLTVDDAVATPQQIREDRSLFHICMNIVNSGQSPARNVLAHIDTDSPVGMAVGDIASGVSKECPIDQFVRTEDLTFFDNSETDVQLDIIVAISFEDVFSINGQRRSSVFRFIGRGPLVEDAKIPLMVVNSNPE